MVTFRIYERIGTMYFGYGLELLGLVLLVLGIAFFAATDYLDRKGEEYVRTHSKDQERRTRGLIAIHQIRALIRQHDDEDFDEPMPRKVLWVNTLLMVVPGILLLYIGRLLVGG